MIPPTRLFKDVEQQTKEFVSLSPYRLKSEASLNGSIIYSLGFKNSQRNSNLYSAPFSITVQEAQCTLFSLVTRKRQQFLLPCAEIILHEKTDENIESSTIIWSRFIIFFYNLMTSLT